MNHERVRIALSSVAAAAALGTAVISVAAQPVDRPDTRIDALEKRVAALERNKEVVIAPASALAPRRHATEPATTSAADVRRYLQYPGQ